MVDGREFTPRDRPDAPFVLVVNEAFARTFFPGERTVGKRLQFGRDVLIEIVGVVHDIRQVAVAEPAQPTIYVHNLQNPRVKMTLVARTEREPLAMAKGIQDAIWSLDPNQSITAVFTFDETMSRALGRPRLVAVLLGAFGVLGLLLGVVGIYGLLAEFVSQRRRDIGVRMALGAEPADVRALFIRRGLTLSGLGIAIGLAGAVALSRGLTTVLYQVSPADPATFAGAAIVLFLAATMASWLPAQRAAHLDPVQTLRQ
jgi:ABC-type antimicrobial peptide transport system permease subunit